jgi:hypothetical protein
VLKATGENGTTIVESVPAGGNQTQQPGGGLLENLTKPFEGFCVLVSACRRAGIPVLFTIAVRERPGLDLLTNTHKILPCPRRKN